MSKLQSRNRPVSGVPHTPVHLRFINRPSSCAAERDSLPPNLPFPQVCLLGTLLSFSLPPVHPFFAIHSVSIYRSHSFDVIFQPQLSWIMSTRKRKQDEDEENEELVSLPEDGESEEECVSFDFYSSLRWCRYQLVSASSEANDGVISPESFNFPNVDLVWAQHLNCSRFESDADDISGEEDASDEEDEDASDVEDPKEEDKAGQSTIKFYGAILTYSSTPQS
jgi:hypothetical protein